MGILDPRYLLFKIKSLNEGYPLEVVEKQSWTNLPIVYSMRNELQPIKMYK